MRDLSASDRNELDIYDSRSDTEIRFYYSAPTTEQEVKYNRQLVQRKGKKVRMQVFETRLEMGLEILTGFRKGDFGIKGRPISTDEEDPAYHKDWKRVLRESASDLVTKFAQTVFEGARTASDMALEFEYEEEKEGEEEETLPPGKSSGG